MIRSFNTWNLGAFVLANVALFFVHWPTGLWINLAQAAFIGGMLVGYGVLRRAS